jgi:hypothetical protein
MNISDYKLITAVIKQKPLLIINVVHRLRLSLG